MCFKLQSIIFWITIHIPVPILNLFDSDDVLDETTVEYGEHFTLDGGEIEIFSTEPYLQIVHKCFVSMIMISFETSS